MRQGLLASMVLLMTVSSSAAAQRGALAPGSIQLGGSASLTHSQGGGGTSVTVFDVSPRLGYFVIHGLALNGNLRFSKGFGGGGRTTSWALGPGLTYYVGGGRLHPFASGRTLFTTNHSGGTRYNAATGQVVALPDSKSTSQIWLVSGGLLCMIGDHVGLSGEMFYQRERLTSGFSGQTSNPSMTIVYGLQWGVVAFVY